MDTDSFLFKLIASVAISIIAALILTGISILFECESSIVLSITTGIATASIVVLLKSKYMIVSILIGAVSCLLIFLLYQFLLGYFGYVYEDDDLFSISGLLISIVIGGYIGLEINKDNVD